MKTESVRIRNTVSYYLPNKTGWAPSASPYKIYPAPIISNINSNTIAGTCNTNISNVYIYNNTTGKQFATASRNGAWAYKNATAGNYSTIGFVYDLSYGLYCKPN